MEYVLIKLLPCDAALPFAYTSWHFSRFHPLNENMLWPVMSFASPGGGHFDYLFHHCLCIRASIGEGSKLDC